MNISRRSWITLSLMALLGLYCWYQFSFSQIAFLNFSLNRTKALNIAQTYLHNKDVDVSTYQSAIVFNMDNNANKYLQRTIGFENLAKFLETHDFDMFFWIVRFYRENEKEEYRLGISSSTGEVIAFKHTIDDTAARKTIPREEAKEKAKKFLNQAFGFDEKDYLIKGDLQHIYDNRSDFSLSWQKSTVAIPWTENIYDGTGKLVTGATIAGDDILSFSKYNFTIPDKFHRHLERLNNTGKNLSTVFIIFYYILFSAAIYYVIVRRNHLAMSTTRRFYFFLAGVSFILTILSTLNLYEIIFFNAKTSEPLKDYLWRYNIETIRHAIFINVALLMPCLAGELLHYELNNQKKNGSLLHNIRSSFLTRRVAGQIGIGYLGCIILLGLQSTMFQIGQTYWGVWIEHTWMTQSTTAYVPFLAAFIIGFKASIFEEFLYRFFAINWGKKIFKSTLIAVLASSLIWGFAHSGYPVYPMWFRGVEVTILGLFLSWIYLRFGLISVIVAHYLFDVFWHTAGYIFGHSTPYYFYSSIFILALPLLWAVVAALINRNDEEKTMRWHLNKHQQYNLEILKTFLKANQEQFKNSSSAELKKEIIGHGWDVGVVDMAIEQLEKDNR